MKRASHKGQTVAAGPDAPRLAFCPECNWPVKLRARDGRFFYRHTRGAPLTCPYRGRMLVQNAPPPAVPPGSYYRLERKDRLYQVVVSHGLWDVSHVSRSWGKKGCKMAGKREPYTNRMDAESAAQRHVRRMIRRGFALVEWF